MFLDFTFIDVKYLVCALAVPGWAKEYSWKCAGAHCVCYSRFVVSFDEGAKGGLAVFVEIQFAAKDNFPGGLLVEYSGGCWEAVQPKYGEVDEVDYYLVRELSVWEVQYKGTAAFFD